MDGQPCINYVALNTGEVIPCSLLLDAQPHEDGRPIVYVVPERMPVDGEEMVEVFADFTGMRETHGLTDFHAVVSWANSGACAVIAEVADVDGAVTRHHIPL